MKWYLSLCIALLMGCDTQNRVSSTTDDADNWSSHLETSSRRQVPNTQPVEENINPETLTQTESDLDDRTSELERLALGEFLLTADPVINLEYRAFLRSEMAQELISDDAPTPSGATEERYLKWLGQSTQEPSSTITSNDEKLFQSLTDAYIDHLFELYLKLELLKKDGSNLSDLKLAESGYSYKDLDRVIKLTPRLTKIFESRRQKRLRNNKEQDFNDLKTILEADLDK